MENSKTAQALRLTLQTIAKLARRTPGAKELRRAKEYTYGQIHLSLESTDNQMMWLGEGLIGHNRVFESRQVDPADRGGDGGGNPRRSGAARP